MPASDFMPAQAFKPMLPLQWRGGKSGAEKNHTVSSVVFFLCAVPCRGTKPQGGARVLLSYAACRVRSYQPVVKQHLY